MMKKIILNATLIIGSLALSQQSNGQGLLNKLKEKIEQSNAQKSNSTNVSENKKEDKKESVKSTLTDFQRKNLKKVIFLNLETIDTESNAETEADNVKELELGQPLCMRYYFDNGGWDSEKEKYLDVRYTVDGISFTGRDFVKYAYDKVDKAPNRNTFGQFVKFESALNADGVMMQKTKEWVTGNMVSPRGAYIPLLMRAEDTFRFFLATKLKSKLTPGTILNLKVEIYRTSESGYLPSTPTTVGEVYASGEIKLKVTDLYKQPDGLFNRFFSEGLVSPDHADGAAKTIQSKFPTTVKKVHKVFFMDADFTSVTHPVTGNVISGQIMAWVLFETQDGVFFNTKTQLTFPYNGSSYGKAPSLMDSGMQEATFPLLCNPFAK